MVHFLAAANKAFKQFDKRGEEQIRVSDIQPAMSAMGVKCKNDWLESIEDTIDESGARANDVIHIACDVILRYIFKINKTLGHSKSLHLFRFQTN